MDPSNVPFIIYAESTPNPAAMKFVANKMMLPANSYESIDPNDNEESPLAQELFNFSFVKGIYITNNFISITKTESIGWEDIVQQVREFIADYLNRGGKVMKDEIIEKEGKAKANEFTSISEHKEPSNDTEKNIIAILDEYVKPSVENDGGSILFESFEEGKVNLILKGACSGCPSSTMTLKSGVENLLKQMMPEEVREVNALNG